MKLYKFISVVLSVFLVLALVMSTAIISDRAEAGSKKLRIAIFVLGFDDDYNQTHVTAAEAVAKADGNTKVTAFDGKFSGAEQFNQIQDATASGLYDGFVIVANDGAVVAPAVEDAIAAGIKVAAVYTPIGRDINSFERQVDGVLCTVGNPIPLNGQRLGEMTLKAAKTLNKDKIRVAYISGGFQLPFENTKQKEFKKAIKADPRIELVAIAEAGFMRDKALAAAQDLVQAHPNIDIITTSGDNMTIGVEDAVVDAGLGGKVLLIGNGAAKIAIDAIREGRWYASYPFLPYTESKMATEILIDALRGKKQPYRAINIEQISPIKPDLWLDIENINKHKDFKPEWRG